MNRRTVIFLSILLSILGSCFYYLSQRLVTGPLGYFPLGILFLSILAIPLIYWVGDRDANTRFDEFVQKMGFFSMGTFSFLLTFTLLRDVLMVLSMKSEAYHDFLSLHGSTFILSLTTFALVVGSISAGRGPRVKTTEVFVDRLPKGLDGFKIALLSDLHIGIMIDRAYVQKTVELTRGLQADIVALTGDIVDETFEKAKEVAAELKGLGPANRIFYAAGNHEYYWNGPEWFEYFKSLGWNVLLNQSRIIEHQNEKVLVGGVVDWAAQEYTKESPDLQAAIQGEATFKILLAHQPKIAPQAAAIGFDLQLSGHTHGGQFFPWTWFAKRVHAIALGLEKVGKMWIYVSPGTGSWGPSIRLGTQTEVSLIILRPRN